MTIRTMERAESGLPLPTQANAFGELRAILLDAHRLGLFADNPVAGIKPLSAAPGESPSAPPRAAVYPSLLQVLEHRLPGDDAFSWSPA